MTALDEFRKEKDAFFKRDQHSPLTDEQQASFDGLKYFPENDALRFDLPLEPFETQDMIMMQTSTGGVQEYQRYGQITFDVEGQSQTLTVYHSHHGFFIPFVDSQAGESTYGAGRYLDPQQDAEGNLVIDFNLAYNPYCAYNDLYTCPIPPAENRLKVPIKAGEKVYK